MVSQAQHIFAPPVYVQDDDIAQAWRSFASTKAGAPAVRKMSSVRVEDERSMLRIRAKDICERVVKYAQLQWLGRGPDVVEIEFKSE